MEMAINGWKCMEPDKITMMSWKIKLNGLITVLTVSPFGLQSSYSLKEFHGVKIGLALFFPLHTFVQRYIDPGQY